MDERISPAAVEQPSERSSLLAAGVEIPAKLVRLLSRFIRDRQRSKMSRRRRSSRPTARCPRSEATARFITWLYGSASNTAKNYLVALGGASRPRPNSIRRTRKDSRAASNCATSNTPESMLMSREIAKKRRRHLDATARRAANAITLREIEGLSLRGYCNDHELPDRHRSFENIPCARAIAEKAATPARHA